MAKTPSDKWRVVINKYKIQCQNILKLSRNFSSITTLSRGGLIPSRLLADSLGIKTILVDQKMISSNSLFVDDIYDSGKTFYGALQNVDNSSKFVFATLFARRGMKYPEQLVYAEKTFDDSYVVFPWDKLEFQNSLK